VIRARNGLVVLATLAVLTACGGGAEANGITKLSADDALAKVQSAAKDVSSVHVAGSVSEQGQSISLDVHAGHDSGVGTLTINGGTLEIRLLEGTAYVKGEAETFTKLGASATQAQLVGGKWLKSSADGGEFAAFTEFLDVDSLFESLLKPDGEVKTGETTTIDGEEVLALVDSADSGKLYVATHGDPLPLRVEKGGEGGGKVDFTDYGDDIDVEVPAGAIDISRLGQ
jgi:hypothetical protein